MLNIRKMQVIQYLLPRNIVALKKLHPTLLLGVKLGVDLVNCRLTAFFGGERGIRTPGTVTRTPHFECGPIDHSGISPFSGALRVQI